MTSKRRPRGRSELTQDELRELTAKKLAFYDVLTKDRALKNSDTRVAWRLLKYYNAEFGYAWPSFEKIAHEIGSAKKTVIESVRRLESGGYFKVVRDKKPGRGDANRYYPLFERVTNQHPLADRERVTPEHPSQKEGLPKPPEKGYLNDPERVTQDAPYNCKNPTSEIITLWRARFDEARARLDDALEQHGADDDPVSFLARLFLQERDNFFEGAPSLNEQKIQADARTLLVEHGDGDLFHTAHTMLIHMVKLWHKGPRPPSTPMFCHFDVADLARLVKAQRLSSM